MKDTDYQASDEIEIQEANRAFAARAEWIDFRMQDVPSIYSQMMPFTNNAQELADGEAALREKLAIDFARYEADKQSPWLKSGPPPKLIDWSTFRAKVHVEIAKRTPMLGMPAPVKPGFGPDGKLWSNHPEVIEAQARAPRTAIYQASDLTESTRMARDEANTAYVIAVSGDDDADQPPADGEMQALVKRELDDAQDRHEKAVYALNALRANPTAALRVVESE